MQSHLKKLFQAIFKVEFSEDMKTITAFQSLEGERVDLLSPVEITETVEEWLANLATQMVKTLEQALRNCLREVTVLKSPSAACFTSAIRCRTYF
jgi:dynein heavy chain 2